MNNASNGHPYASHNACAALVEMYAGILNEASRREQAALMECARLQKENAQLKSKLSTETTQAPIEDSFSQRS